MGGKGGTERGGQSENERGCDAVASCPRPALLVNGVFCPSGCEGGNAGILQSWFLW